MSKSLARSGNFPQGWYAYVEPFRETFEGSARPLLLLLMGAVSPILPMQSIARTSGGPQNWAGRRHLSRFPVPLLLTTYDHLDFCRCTTLNTFSYPLPGFLVRGHFDRRWRGLPGVRLRSQDLPGHFQRGAAHAPEIHRLTSCLILANAAAHAKTPATLAAAIGWRPGRCVAGLGPRLLCSG
jgi:hypothetical protein